MNSSSEALSGIEIDRATRVYRTVVALVVIGLVVQAAVAIHNGASPLAVIVADALILIFARFAYKMGEHSARG